MPSAPEEDVLAAKDKGAAPTAQTPEAEAKAEAEDGEDDAPVDEPAPADTPKPLKRKINKLLRERAEARERIAAMEPVAQIGHELQTFAVVNNLSGDDIVLGMTAMAQLQAGDYAGFYRTVGPYVRRAQEYLGVVLPDDLSQRVQQGHMTVEAASEFARTRFDQERAQTVARESVQAQSGAQLRAIQADVQRAVSALENRFASNDPDYKAKADQLKRVTQAMLLERGGTISSVEEALELTTAAYKEVNSAYRRMNPAPRPTDPRPNGHAQTPSARPAPKTLMEAALQGLEDARRAGH